jgi:hypothetical protein
LLQQATPTLETWLKIGFYMLFQTRKCAEIDQIWKTDLSPPIEQLSDSRQTDKDLDRWKTHRSVIDVPAGSHQALSIAAWGYSTISGERNPTLRGDNVPRRTAQEDVTRVTK